MIEILYKSRNAAVVNKPAAVPSQSDLSGDPDALTLTAEMLREIGERDELYLVHRLDRVVGGLMIFARNKRCAATLSSLVAGVGIGKEYLAVIDGYLEGGMLSDYLYKDARQGKAFVVDRIRAGVKTAELEFSPLASVSTERGIKTLVKIKLHTGRFHQIRVQFSSRGTPITGDGKYGSRDNSARTPALFSYRLSTELDGENITVTKFPDTTLYPWCLFNEKIYGELEK